MQAPNAVLPASVPRSQRLVEPPRWFTAAKSIAGRSSSAKALLRWLYARFWQIPTRAAAIDRYLREHPVAKLELGASWHQRDGWLCTDLHALPPIIYLDASKRFPLADGRIDYVYSEHMIEHVPYEVALAMVKECYRVLKPGGRIRIATPDLDVHTALADGRLNAPARQYVEWMNATSPLAYRNRTGFVINRMFYDWGHCFIYDQQTLTDLLERAGFAGIERYSVGLSDDPELAGLEMHGENVPPEVNAFQTMVLEAAKPASRLH